MAILSGCCCFNTLKAGSRASAIFTIVTALCNIAIDIVSLVRLQYFWDYFISQETWLFMPPGIIALIYFELFFSLCMIALGIILLIGINYGQDGKRFIYAWMFGMAFDRFYDTFLGVYIMSWIGGHRFTEIVYVIPESIFVAVYWIINSFVLVAAMLCVWSYWQELMDDLYGKERRNKYYSKMANIRSAALSGAATPYRSYYGSRSTVFASQGNLNPGYVHKY